MKKILLLIFSIYSLGLFSQAEKALVPSYNNLLGGSLSLSSDENNNIRPTTDIFIPQFPITIIGSTVTDTKNFSFHISPYYGRYINKNLVMGLRTQYSWSKIQTIGFTSTNIDFPLPNLPIVEPIERVLSESTTKSFDIWAFARYLFSTNNKLSFYLEPMIGRRSYERISTSSSNSSTSQSELIITDSGVESTLLDIRVIPGLSYALSPRWNLLASLGLVRYSFGTEDSFTNYTTASSFPEPNLPQNTSRQADVSDFYSNFRLSTFYFSVEFRF